VNQGPAGAAPAPAEPEPDMAGPPGDGGGAPDEACADAEASSCRLARAASSAAPTARPSFEPREAFGFGGLPGTRDDLADAG
jgi:hypothetical protein